MVYDYDLHIHTTASDGTLTPAEVIEQAVATGLKGIAISDHDTMAGLQLAQQYIDCREYKLDFIPGIELNTEADEEDIHILGYFVNPENRAINLHLKDIRDARYSRAKKMVERLRQEGLEIDFSRVESIAQGESIGRPHIARALIEKSYVSAVKEAFIKYIGRGCPGYVPRYKFLPGEAIELIKNADGIAVLAHPGLIKDKAKIREIINLGIEGLEVYYPEHSSEQIKELSALAARHKLLITGGSDYHGPDSHEGRAVMGSGGISRDLIDGIYEYHCLKANKKIEINRRG